MKCYVSVQVTYLLDKNFTAFYHYVFNTDGSLLAYFPHKKQSAIKSNGLIIFLELQNIGFGI